ncbi:IQ domain-containing protein C isoform X2 [Antechinus flavipes]|uniref:IQ domain-containing protein C isoform X2 n=1 Tax=Antechinus flavipes TaxID=38775 RepID=UPI002235FCAE|nr:IQ domain-containing protein C isoform X2 [Antechinus flavipes]
MTTIGGAGKGRDCCGSSWVMELHELVRRVTKLQACVRGRQTRRRLQSLRAEYEEVVRQVEGDLGGQPRWVGRWLPRPVFSPEARRRPCGPRTEGGSSLGPVQEPLSRLQSEEPEADGGRKEPSPVKGPEQQDGFRVDQEGSPQNRLVMEAGDPMLRRIPGSSSSLLSPYDPPKTPLPNGPKTPNSRLELNGNGAFLEGTSLCDQLVAFSDISCNVSTYTEALELTPASQPAQLQKLRRHLAMEMLWLQQAIVSRKKYLLLRQTLDLPEN